MSYITQSVRAIASRIDNCQDKHAIASSELNSYLERQVGKIAPERRTVRTPQRKANYNDKARLRRARLKQIAYEDYGCSSNTQIKDYLRLLGIKLDLRMTSAWVAIVHELRHEIFAAKVILDALKPQPQQVLLAAMKEAIALCSWNPVKALLVTHAEYKDAAWKQLSVVEKQQLTALVPETVKLLTQAKRNGTIANFEEDEEGDIYWVWRSNNAKPELVTSSLKNFLHQIGAIANKIS